jgi:hypothetical protein
LVLMSFAMKRLYTTNSFSLIPYFHIVAGQSGDTMKHFMK